MSKVEQLPESTRFLLKEILESEAHPDFEERMKDPSFREGYEQARQQVEEDLAYLQRQAREEAAREEEFQAAVLARAS